MSSYLNKGRKQLLLLMAFFAAPILVAVIAFNTVMEDGPGNTKNKGDLVSPARPLIDVVLKDVNNNDFKFSDMKKTWVMIYIGNSSCDEACKNSLYNMRQSRLAQKGEHKRIKRLYISTSGKAKQSLVNVLKEHPGLKFVSGDVAAIKDVLKQFVLKNKPSAGSAQRLYLVDPLGNLMMSYEKGFDPKGIVKDLEILLKISRIG